MRQMVSVERGRVSRALSATRSALKRVFLPPTPIVALAAPAIAGLMAWVFLLGNENTPLAYVAYVISAYLLIVLCVAFVRSPIVRRANEALHRNEHAARLLDDQEHRRTIAVAGSLVIDIFWSVVNLVLGVVDASVWLITLGAYYLVLALARGFVLAFMRKTKGAVEEISYRVEFMCGVMLLVSTFVLSGIVTLTIKGIGSFEYEGLLIYSVATYAFYSLVSSLIGFFRLRNHDDPLVVVNARINLSVALVSIFALEVAMLSAFGTERDAELTFIMPILTGTAIAVVLIAMGIKSIVEGSSGRHRLQNAFRRK